MKLRKIIAIVLSISIVLGITGFYIKDDIFVSVHKNSVYSQNEKSLADDISDITGKSPEKILNLQSSTNNWNETLNILKGNIQNEKHTTDEQLEKSLSLEGFSEENVKLARENVIQLKYNLNEICNFDVKNTVVPSIDITKDNSENDILSYQKINDNLDDNLLIYLCLKLKDDFDLIDDIINEYLYCLQVDIDFLLYIEDRGKYQQEILSKSAILLKDDAITLQKISDLLLSNINNKNIVSEESLDSGINSQNDINKENDLLPNVKDPRPKDPTAEVMEEINSVINSYN